MTAPRAAAIRERLERVAKLACDDYWPYPAIQHCRHCGKKSSAHLLRQALTLLDTGTRELEEAKDDMCGEHRAQGGDPDCDRCFRQNYEEIGRDLVQRLKQQMPDYSYAASPVEVVGDLLSQIDDKASALAAVQQELEEQKARIAAVDASRDQWKRRAEDAEGRIGNALA